ncbi:hypothetical protein [Actinomadura litoris]|uniref:Uncharacterized protein n=1 Tax=Actinomadura litoris TaxID=2678616 RepID=A0A7K1L556_9ACTN|nr:hypothetical protein [Actinomadura litoris]MUN39564.1 hypothetical protein [Actinomadura litoris]
MSRNMEAVRAVHQALTDSDLDRFIESLNPRRRLPAVGGGALARHLPGVRGMFGKLAERAAATYEPARFTETDEHIVVPGNAPIAPPGAGEPTIPRRGLNRSPHDRP